MLGLLLFFVFVFLLGIIIGSFLNVCIIRIPRGESIVVVPSHCMSCGYNLKWYDLIPLFSYIFLGGKCRKCGSKLSIQYPIVEAINGIAYVLIFIRFADIYNLDLISWIEALIYCLLFSALLVLTVIDWRTFEIPLGINIFILVLGVGHIFLDLENWYVYVIGLVCVSIPLWLLLIISKGKAIGGGDVKLMAAAGLLLGWKNILLAFVLGCIIGSIIHIIRMKVSGEGKVLAMGPYLSAGIMIAVLFGDYIINAYLSIIGIA